MGSQGLTDNVNLMAMNLTNQVRSIAEVTKAVAGGDLTKRITVDVRGEMLDLKETVNGMTESLSLFADEVTRVAKEVGTEGLLGGQAQVSNVGGTWKDLTDNVNVMAANVRSPLFCVVSLKLMSPGAVDVASANDRAGHPCRSEGRPHSEGHGRTSVWRDTRPRQHHQQHD